MRYEIQQRAEREHVVFDNQTQQFARGRFPTSEQAQEWINTQEAKAVLATVVGPQTGMRGRARAYLITDCDYYGTNEHNILTVALRLLGAVRQAVIL